MVINHLTADTPTHRDERTVIKEINSMMMLFTPIMRQSTRRHNSNYETGHAEGSEHFSTLFLKSRNPCHAI